MLMLRTLPALERVFDDVMRETLHAFALPRSPLAAPADTEDNRRNDTLLGGALTDETDRFVLAVDLPGVDPGRVEIWVEPRALAVRGIRRHGARELAMERRYDLPSTVAPDRAVATMEHGVLVVELPKEDARKVELRVGRRPGVVARARAWLRDLFA